MCGIAGKVRYDGEPVAEPLVQRMCRAMVHRGPDSYGAFVRGSRRDRGAIAAHY